MAKRQKHDDYSVLKECTAVPLSKAKKAIQLCFNDEVLRKRFTQTVLADVLTFVAKREPLPLLFWWSVLQSMQVRGATDVTVYTLYVIFREAADESSYTVLLTSIFSEAKHVYADT